MVEEDWAPATLPNWDSRTTASGYDLFCIPAVTRRTATAEIWARVLNHAVLFFPLWHENFHLTIYKKLNLHIPVNLLCSKGTESVLQLCGRIKLAPMKKDFSCTNPLIQNGHFIMKSRGFTQQHGNMYNKIHSRAVAASTNAFLMTVLEICQKITLHVHKKCW